MILYSKSLDDTIGYDLLEIKLKSLNFTYAIMFWNLIVWSHMDYMYVRLHKRIINPHENSTLR